MKKVSLLIIAVLCVSVSILAGEVITNNTGEDATGLRIVFSEPVLITNFGDVLTSVDPQMLSDEVVFSGGTAKPWDSQWFNYTPASAIVVRAEWLTGAIGSAIPTGEMTREELLTLGRAPTFDEIMSAIGEYPGADEPLYQTRPDEPIWLTDLDGHGDIYDNDSVKINYADWFDRSQIAKIEVYRNGVEMRFLPDKFGVLTNEQMKTFDGNMLEKTPASSHADHAILGYIFEVRILGDAGSPLFTKQFMVRSRFRFQGERYIYIGHNFHERMGVPDEVLLNSLEELKEIGFTGIQLGTYYFLQSATSTEVFSQYESDPGVGCYTTPSDNALRRMLRLAHQAGMRSELRIELWMRADWKALHGGDYRGDIHPTNLAEWFENYTKVVIHYARLAEQEGVDILCIGVELASLERYTEFWHNLASEVRKVFSGDLTFAEATNLFMEESNSQGFQGSVGRFWPDYDQIEMNCWSPPISDSLDQRYSEMLSRFVGFWSPAFAFYERLYPSIPLAFGEIGIWNFDGTSMGYSEQRTKSDLQEFADMWAVYLAGSALFDIKRIAIWNYALVGSPGGVGSTWLNDTAALQEIAAVFGGVAPQVQYITPVAAGDQPDWEFVNWIESYSKAVRPTKYWKGGRQLPVPQGTNWGLPGSDVKGVKIAATDVGVFIRCETYADSMGASYTYQLHLRPPDRHETILFVNFNPETALADLSQSVEGVWYGLESQIRIVEATKSSVTCFIPLRDLPSGDSAQEIEHWNLVTELIYKYGSEEEEYYELPHTNALR